MAELDPVQDEEVDVPGWKQAGRQACANIKESWEQALKELPDGFCVCEAGRSKATRLHKLGYCWMVPGVDYFVQSKGGSCLRNTSMRRCASAGALPFTPMPQDSGSDTDPSTDVD